MKKQTPPTERDSTFLLKIVLYMLAGALWLRFDPALKIGDFSLSGIPVGLCIGLIFTQHEHFQIDRKLEYVVLILMTVLTFFLPAGILI